MFASVHDANPVEIPRNFSEPPSAVAPDFSAATQGTRALRSLTAARNSLLSDPTQLVQHLNLDEGASKLHISNIFEDSILIGSTPPPPQFIALFKSGHQFSFGTRKAHEYFQALLVLYQGYSRSRSSKMLFSKPDWNDAKALAANPAEFGMATENMSSLMIEVSSFIRLVRRAALSEYSSWPPELQRARATVWPSSLQVVLHAPPLVITVDATFLACAGLSFKGWFDCLEGWAVSWEKSAAKVNRLFNMLAQHDCLQYFWGGYYMMLMGIFKPSLENLNFSLRGSLFRVPMYQSFMDMWLSRSLELKKIKKPTRWLDSLKGIQGLFPPSLLVPAPLSSEKDLVELPLPSEPIVKKVLSLLAPL